MLSPLILAPRIQTRFLEQHQGCRLRVANSNMSSASIIRVGHLAAGVLTLAEDGRVYTFHAADQRFRTLDGSSFANRNAAQRAAERVAAANEGRSAVRRVGIGAAA